MVKKEKATPKGGKGKKAPVTEDKTPASTPNKSKGRPPGKGKKKEEVGFNLTLVLYLLEFSG